MVLHNWHHIVELVLVLMVLNLLTLCVVMPITLLLILLKLCYLLFRLLFKHLCNLLFPFTSSFSLRLLLLIKLLRCHLHLDRLGLHVPLLLGFASGACDNIVLVVAGLIWLVI